MGSKGLALLPLASKQQDYFCYPACFLDDLLKI